jgi:peptide deformylase
MAILPLITAPDPILKQRSLPVASVDSKVRGLMTDMLETMYHDSGVGLAAVQVGVLKRVIVLDLQEDDDVVRVPGFYPLRMADPEITERNGEVVIAAEGCLSLPEQRVEVARPDKIKVSYLDFNNVKQELETDGWLSRAIQHEVDHLDGKLLIDYLTSIKKDVALRKLTKLKKHCL